MAEKKVIEIEIQDNTKSLKAQYKEAVQEVQKLVQAYGETSQEAAEAAKRAAELKDQIEDTNDAIAAFKGEGVFNATGKAISSVASGFSAVEGAVALVGVESEALQETMVRLQAAMALSQGLQGLEDAGRAFKQLGAVAINAFKGIRGAILATGIGVLVVALGTVVAYWDDIKAAVNGVSKEQQKLNQLSKANYENSKKTLETLDAQDNVLKLQGKSEKEILNLKIKKADIALQNGQIELENVRKTSEAEEKAAIRNYNLTKKVVDFIIDTALFLPKLMLMPIDLAIKGANKVSEALGIGKAISFDLGKTIEGMEDQFSSFIAGSLFNVNEVKSEGEKSRKEIQDDLDKIANQRAGFVLQIRDINKKAAKELGESKFVINDQLIKQQQLDAENLKRLEEFTVGQNAKLKTATDVTSGIIEQRTRELEHDRYVAEEQRRIDAETAQRRKRNIEFTADAIAQTFSIIAQLTQANDKMSEKQARRAFNINKMAQIGQATATTYLSATKAYASQIIPGDPTSVVRGQVAAGLAIASGLANVAMIARQQFNAPSTSGGGSMSASSGGGGIVAPNLNVVGDTGINQLAQLGQTPIKAYVVSNDITTAQMFDLKVQQTAIL